MSDSDEKTIALLKRLNTSAVKVIVDPPGLYEAKDPRKRKGIKRIPYRSGREPSLQNFIHVPAISIEMARARGEDAKFWGAQPSDKPSTLFARRIHWESHAPRYTSVGGWSLGMIDFWYDKAMYGKVDINQNSIYISEAFLTSLNKGDASIMAPVFVAHAWRDFQKEWARFFAMNLKATNQRGQGTGPMVADVGKYRPNQGVLQVKSCWTSIHPQYQANMERIFEGFQQWTNSEGRQQKILNFKDFMQYMLRFIDIAAPMVQFTRSGYIMSGECNRAISGWQIDLYSEDPNNDVTKKEMYLNDPNFEVFVAMAQKFGFMVDFNCPWRLVADVMSTPMRRYIRDWAVEGKDHQGKGTNIPELVRRRDEWQKEATKTTRGGKPTQTKPGQRDKAYKMAQTYDALIKKYQTKNLDIMFRTCYYRADSTDLKVLMNYFVSMWNSFAGSFPSQAIAIHRPTAETSGTNSEVVMITHYRSTIEFDGAASADTSYYATVKRENHSMLAGKTINRKNNSTKPSSYDVFSDTFGTDFPAKLYLFVRAREAAADWTQRIFEQNVKDLADIQKNLDGNQALDYINNKTDRLPNPGGNPPFRTVQNKAKTFNQYVNRERSNAGRGQFMLYI
jgi:hypothetical protein